MSTIEGKKEGQKEGRDEEGGRKKDKEDGRKEEWREEGCVLVHSSTGTTQWQGTGYGHQEAECGGSWCVLLTLSSLFSQTPAWEDTTHLLDESPSLS